MMLWQDIRFGARTLRKSPGFTLTAVITLALGIGATTAVYSTADALLWKPVPLPNMDRLAMVLERVPGDPNDWSSVTAADFDDIRRENTSFAAVAGWQSGAANIVGSEGEPERVQQYLVSANFFEVAGQPMALGRSFDPQEEQPGREREVILSDGLWRRLFGGDPHLIGRSIRLDDQDYTVIGVTPRNFEFPKTAELWTPMALTPAQRNQRASHSIVGVGLLKPGRTAAEAASEVDAIGARLAARYPNTNKNRRFEISTAHDFLISNYTHQYVLMLLDAVLFVLLIACVNVANLQLARAMGRTREVAVRTALGAGRRHLLVQFLSENVLLSVLGVLPGLAVASWGLAAIKSGMPPAVEKYIQGWKDISLDGRALAFTLTAAVLCGVLAGVLPAWQVSRPNLTGALKDGGRGASAGRGRHRLRGILVAAEIALSVVLLTGASLMVRGVTTHGRRRRALPARHAADHAAGPHRNTLPRSAPDVRLLSAGAGTHPGRAGRGIRLRHKRHALRRPRKRALYQHRGQSARARQPPRGDLSADEPQRLSGAQHSAARRASAGGIRRRRTAAGGGHQRTCRASLVAGRAPAHRQAHPPRFGGPTRQLGLPLSASRRCSA